MFVTRRQFGIMLSAAPAAVSIARAAAGSDAIVERRVYDRTGAVPPSALLRKCGAKLIRCEKSGMRIELTIAFASLVERTRAWDRFNTDPDWCALRESSEVRLHEISIAGV